MAFRPYVDSTGETLLTELMARVGRSVGQVELQFAINGWTSQMLAVKGDVSDLTPADVKKFATKRGYAETAFAVKRLCEVIRGSRSPVIEKVGVDAWRMRFGPKKDVPTYEQIKQLFVEYAREYHPSYIAESGTPIITTAATISGVEYWSGHIIPTWRVDIAEHSKWLEVNGALGGDRWRDPMGWFVTWCASRGLNLSCHPFKGFFKCSNQNDAFMPGGEGFTIIKGPVDLFGLQPVWHMPLISEFVGVLDFGFTDGGGVFNTSVFKFTYAGKPCPAIAALLGPKCARFVVCQDWPKPEDQVLKFEDREPSYGRANGWVQPVPTAEIGRLRATLGVFAEDLVQAEPDGGWQPAGSPPY